VTPGEEAHVVLNHIRVITQTHDLNFLPDLFKVGVWELLQIDLLDGNLGVGVWAR
jgi:hypothetical protein